MKTLFTREEEPQDPGRRHLLFLHLILLILPILPILKALQRTKKRKEGTTQTKRQRFQSSIADERPPQVRELDFTAKTQLLRPEQT